MRLQPYPRLISLHPNNDAERRRPAALLSASVTLIELSSVISGGVASVFISMGEGAPKDGD
jgi:hypothetical protein